MRWEAAEAVCCRLDMLGKQCGEAPEFRVARALEWARR